MYRVIAEIVKNKEWIINTSNPVNKATFYVAVNEFHYIDALISEIENALFWKCR